MPNRADVQARQDAILRLERYWALANVLAAKAGGPSASGVRGVTYAEAQQKALERSGQRSTGSSFVLLSRQLQYGVVGIYGNVAHGLRLLDRKTLTLTSDFGETLGSAFLEETGAPKSLRAAVGDPERDVGLEVLRAWGEKANLTGESGPEEARILGILGDRVVRIDHTGSTSVPGLAAKPVIDITMVVPDSSDEAAYVPDLEAAGYKLVIREPEWFEHRVFKGPDTNINLHVFSPGCQEIDRMVGFRDWLRTHDDDRHLYERTKRELASQTWAYVQNYADAKTEVVEAIVARATLPPRVD
jgi:GrpB-like predicted nucleotidyltransferase (UPF0157 family)